MRANFTEKQNLKTNIHDIFNLKKALQLEKANKAYIEYYKTPLFFCLLSCKIFTGAFFNQQKHNTLNKEVKTQSCSNTNLFNL